MLLLLCDLKCHISVTQNADLYSHIYSLMMGNLLDYFYINEGSICTGFISMRIYQFLCTFSVCEFERLIG